jgi:ATP/maltotriose-dependent transcriptional regulator MalT
MLAHALYAQGRLDEAEALALTAARLAAQNDIEVETQCRSLRAKVLARRGEFDEAVQLAKEAVDLLPRTEAPVWRSEALLDAAEVVLAAGHPDRAREALEEAFALAELKQMRAPAARIHARLRDLRVESSRLVS